MSNTSKKRMERENRYRAGHPAGSVVPGRRAQPATTVRKPGSPSISVNISPCELPPDDQRRWSGHGQRGVFLGGAVGKKFAQNTDRDFEEKPDIKIEIFSKFFPAH
jgi:hypothetical protein